MILDLREYHDRRSPGRETIEFTVACPRFVATQESATCWRVLITYPDHTCWRSPRRYSTRRQARNAARQLGVTYLATGFLPGRRDTPEPALTLD